MRINFLRNVLPGEQLEEKVCKNFTKEGLSVVQGEVYKAGSLTFLDTKGIYVPQENDLVIIKIFYKCSEFYKCDLNGFIGVLPSLSFTNATKRNKPELEVNDYIFAKVIKVGSEVLLSCNGDKLGKVEGYIESFSPYQIRKLYLGLINEIGKRYKFKIFLGLNGKVCCVGEPAVISEVFKFIGEI
ncbi:S1-like RNA-binding domain-containing protein [Tubulinosema ratisbonensis]|uniref:S1-like RNA-binding domain-containing protein n=1 Tax=Tubulinosema ratisbonensis TaxID=291195 RepID=A0A437AM69_9MICR|nr:S1-like RNA-binding domain-containing protein [Tubulinosema ratisbonensis]